MIVPTYNWAEHLGPHFDKIQHIKAQHHFHFTSFRSGEVTTKKLCDLGEVSHCILLGSHMETKGLSLKRKGCFYTKISEFCSRETRDQVCPYPGPGRCPPCISTICQSASHRNPLHFLFLLHVENANLVNVGKRVIMHNPAKWKVH